MATTATVLSSIMTTPIIRVTLPGAALVASDVPMP